jgi:hypothetical protein
MLLIVSSTVQSKIIRACANRFLPLLLIQRVVMNGRLGFEVTLVNGSSSTAEWSDDAIFGIVFGTSYQSAMLVYILSKIALPRVGTRTVCFHE